MTSSRRTDHDGSESEGEPLLRRWSRRKHDARERDTTARDDSPESPPEPSAEGAPETAGDTTGHAPAEDAGADLPTDADMPPIESLGADSDYSQFMSPQVSESLRRMALRKLFGASAFNVRDGLDDYDEDFTRYQSLGDTVTADMKYHAERRARAAEQEEESVSVADSEAAEGLEAEPDASDEHTNENDPTEPPLADAGDTEEEPIDDRS